MISRPTELHETAEMMKSNEYKERFRAEYYQLDMRLAKLHKMLVKYAAGTLDFKPDSPIEVLVMQETAMKSYKHALEMRAEYEGVEL